MTEARHERLVRKAALLTGTGAWSTGAWEEEGLPALWLSDGPHGVRRETAPLVSLPATCFPTSSALSASWDRHLIHEVTAAIGSEAALQGVSVLLGPGINIKRTPVCGRNFEYFSEDPHLTAELASAYVNGLQSTGVGACVKHFALNNQEDQRHWISVEVDERTAREVYLRPFHRVITRTGPASVMCSYNRVWGVHASQNHWLLTQVLREEWGYDGLVMSDWGAVHDRVAALRAGLDLEMPGGEHARAGELIAAATAGDVGEDLIDRSLERLRALAQRVPAAAGPTPLPADMAASHHALARRAAADGVVLLHNAAGVLPLTATGARVAVVGELAASPRIQGGGSADVNPTRTDTLLEQLAEAATVAFASGYVLRSIWDEGPGCADHDALVAEAVDAAASCDVAVVLVGPAPGVESEGYDRSSLHIDARQQRVVREVIATGTPTVVVLVCGSVVIVGDWCDGAAALLQGWLGGQAAAAGLADVLLGRVDPGGRLAETMPMREQDHPAFLGHPGQAGVVTYGEGVFVGYRWYDARDLPVRYPFGHGETYTTFDYLEADLQQTAEGDIAVEVVVRNSGQRFGREVVQVYVESPQIEVPRPVRELVGFAKVALRPGEQARVRIVVDSADLERFDPLLRRWRRDAGIYTLRIGRSSRDLRLQVDVELAGRDDDPLPTADDLGRTVMEIAGRGAGPLVMRNLSPEAVSGPQDYSAGA